MNPTELIAVFLPSLQKLIGTFKSDGLSPDPELQHRMEELAKLMASYLSGSLSNSPDVQEILSLAKSEAALIDTRLKIKHGYAVNLAVHNALIYSLELALNIALLIK